MTGRRLIVEADGGSRGNPGPAGYGVVVRDARTGEVLAERSVAIGRATNNVAEYQGLIAGLQAAVELGGDAVEARLDSKLLVEQMSGRWQVKHPDMRVLARQAGDLVGQLGSVRFTWIPRALNTRADRLANDAMDAVARSAGRTTGVRGTEPATGPPTWPSDSPAAPGHSRAGLPVGLMHGTAPPTTTMLLRHAQTARSGDQRFGDREGAGLTEAGAAQARALADRVARLSIVAAVVSSPSPAARQTADVVGRALDLPVIEEPGLVETDFGQWAGLKFSEVRDRWPAEFAAWLASADAPAPQGESLAATVTRVRRARDEVLRRFPGTTVAVVTHGTPIKTLLRLALDAPPPSLFRMQVDPAGISEVQWYADGPAVVARMNDVAHLDS